MPTLWVDAWLVVTVRNQTPTTNRWVSSPGHQIQTLMTQKTRHDDQQSAIFLQNRWQDRTFLHFWTKGTSGATFHINTLCKKAAFHNIWHWLCRSFKAEHIHKVEHILHNGFRKRNTNICRKISLICLWLKYPTGFRACANWTPSCCVC